MHLPHAAQSFVFAPVPVFRPRHTILSTTGAVPPAGPTAAARRPFRRFAVLSCPALCRSLSAARTLAVLVLAAAAVLGTGPRAAAQSPYVWNGPPSGTGDWN